MCGSHGKPDLLLRLERLTPRSGVFMSSAKWEGVRGDLTSVVCSHLYVSWAVMECTVYLSTSRGGK